MSSHATLDEAKSAAAELKHIEDEIAKVHSALERTGAGVTEPLVDQEGYPRSDVDVHAARCVMEGRVCVCVCVCMCMCMCD